MLMPSRSHGAGTSWKFGMTGLREAGNVKAYASPRVSQSAQLLASYTPRSVLDVFPVQVPTVARLVFGT